MNLPDSNPKQARACRDLDIHAHLCLIDSGAAQHAVIEAFARAGLARGEQCLCLVGDAESSPVLAALRAAGLADAGPTGKFRAADTRAIPQGESGTDFGPVIRLLADAAAAAQPAGYAGLCVISEMAGILGAAPDVTRVLAYEKFINQAVNTTALRMLCQYDRDRLAPEVIRQALFLHPLLVAGGVICKNPYCRAYDGQSRPERISREVDRMLANAAALERTEREQRDGAERFQSIFEAATDAIISADNQGRIAFWNRAAQAIFGYQAAEAIGQPITLLIPDRFRGKHQWLYQATAAGERAIPIKPLEVVGVRKDGTEFPVEISVAAWNTSEGICFTSIVRDISGSKRAIRALRESEARFRAVFADAAIGIALLDLQGRAFESNRAFQELLGYSADELRGMTFTKYTHPEDVETNLAYFREMAAGRRDAYQMEKRYLRKDGRLIWTRLRVSLVHDVDSRPQFTVAMVEDITERKQAKDALRESENRYRSLFQDNHAVMLLIDPETERVVDANPAACTFYGYSKEEITARKLWDIRSVSPEAARREMERAWLEQRAHFYFQHCRATGEVRDVEVYNGPIQVGGKPLLYSIVHDITERKHAENALRETTERLRAIIESSPLAIVALDRDMKVTAWNLAAERILGWHEAEVLGKPYPAVPEERREEFQRLWVRLQRDDRFTDLDSCRLRQDGVRLDVSVSLAALHDAQGRMNGVMGVLTDITGRKRADAVRRRMAAIIEAMPQLVATADVNGRLLTLNGAGRKLLGLTANEKIADTLMFDYYPASARDILRREALPAAMREGIWTGETVLRNREGQEIPVSHTILAHQGADGSLEYFSILAGDISARVRMEEELRQAQKMEAVGRLAGGIAHDFNNLLMPIMSYSELLRETLDSAHPMHRYADQIAKTAERAASLPRQLLAFSRKQIIQPKVLDLNAVIADLYKMLHRLIGEDIQLRTFAAPALGHVKVDPGQIEQVLLNLVVNARDAMPRGGKLIIETANVERSKAYAHRHHGVTPGPYVMLAVSDTGCGMDKKTQSHIFEPFFTTKEQGKGTGLGLSTVYGIVSQSGGHIRVYSEVDKGTTVQVYMPQIDEGIFSAEADAPAAVASVDTATILVVEDEEVVRATVCEMLEMSGYTVLSADNGESALQVGTRHTGPIHLMLTDVVMPGMSGRDLAERLLPSRPEMRVLFMSGYTENAIVYHGVLDDGISFIQKPFKSSALLRKVQEVLRKA